MNDCFEVLKNIVAETTAEPYLLSILQHLLYIRDDHLFRPAYFQLIEECVSQIVLHKAGCDPNFDSRDFHIDTSMLLDDLVEKSRAKETMKKEEYDKKLEVLETARQEAEARALHLEEKIREYEATGVIPQKVSKLPQVNIPPPPPPPPMPGMRPTGKRLHITRMIIIVYQNFKIISFCRVGSSTTTTNAWNFQWSTYSTTTTTNAGIEFIFPILYIYNVQRNIFESIFFRVWDQ